VRERDPTPLAYPSAGEAAAAAARERRGVDGNPPLLTTAGEGEAAVVVAVAGVDGTPARAQGVLVSIECVSGGRREKKGWGVPCALSLAREWG
jgi:hypothetical protein